MGGVYTRLYGVYADGVEPRNIVLYGKSMLLTLVAASLSPSENLRVVQAGSWGEVEALAASCPPDVLIYDLTVASEGLILMLLHKNPSLQLIGLDEETSRAVLFSGQEAPCLTLERIKEIVERSIPIDSAE